MTWKGKVLGNQVAVQLDFYDSNNDFRDYYILCIILMYLESITRE